MMRVFQSVWCVCKPRARRIERKSKSHTNFRVDFSSREGCGPALPPNDARFSIRFVRLQASRTHNRAQERVTHQFSCGFRISRGGAVRGGRRLLRVFHSVLCVCEPRAHIIERKSKPHTNFRMSFGGARGGAVRSGRRLLRVFHSVWGVCKPRAHITERTSKSNVSFRVYFA